MGGRKKGKGMCKYGESAVNSEVIKVIVGTKGASSDFQGKLLEQVETIMEKTIVARPWRSKYYDYNPYEG